MNCEWDDKKAASNLEKHGVSFEEAETVFDDILCQIFDDPMHSDDETRNLAVGFSNQNRLLFVAYTNRGEVPRLISAREATAQEKRNHERRESINPQEMADDDLLPEYDLDYSKARPNPFVKRVPGSKVIVIEPDVASVFSTQEEVNTALRALISAMPKTALKTGA